MPTYKTHHMLAVAILINKLKNAKFLFLSLLCFTINANAQKTVLDSNMHYVRNVDKPEWEEFNNRVPVEELAIHFRAKENLTDQTLELRQYDVKQTWQVLLNGNKLGSLVTDMNDMKIYLVIPPNTIIAGQNLLEILPASKVADDIVVGQVVLHQRTLNELLHESKINLEVVDKKTNSAIPSKITIVNTAGVLQMAGVASNSRLAVRPGTIYSVNGKSSIGLPAGDYTIYATRGFEYSVDSFKLTIKPGEQLSKKMFITQEVETKGWVSSDTHVHSYTYSRHGDATIEERAITIAGEGIELPVMTDHNIKVDIAPVMRSLGVDQYYTPVIGTEFTTNLGHFNLFPEALETAVPNHQLKDWTNLPEIINPAGNKIVILNHARDIHIGFRPFDAMRHVSVAGLNLDGWKFPANAMEIVNSGSLQTNKMLLIQDWFGMMNRGYFLTPVGSSDSHDVSRYLVGQARTYIKSDDARPDQIDIKAAINNFHSGKVSVSMGLLTQITINKKYSVGELAPATKNIEVSVQVLGPGWTNVNRISLYANGKKIRETLVKPIKKPGVKWKGTWVLPKFKNDVFLVAIAEGPYKYLPFWPIVKPFQPTSAKWTPSLIGCSGAAWIDSDGDGLRSSAFDYATKAWSTSKNNMHTFIKLLGAYDESVAVQAASLLQQQGWSLTEAQLQKALQKASPYTRSGFHAFLLGWNQSKEIKK